MKVEHRTYKTNAGERQIYNALILATQKCGATVFQVGKHEFYPHGLSAFVILGESHTAVHTFPERQEVWVEIVSCSDKIDTEKFFREFEKYVRT